MSKRIITISRQFGSGGHSIGEKVAEKLGIAFYDSEKLTQKIAAETDFDISFIRENDEKAYSGMGMFFDLGIHGGTSFTSLSLYDQLYIAQHNAIREVAEKEPCVIVGRCADYVLEDRDDALHVLIYADNDYRASRILGEYGKRDLKIEKRMKDKDNKRMNYYKHYTNREWGDAMNYHLCLNSGVIGIDECVDIIVDIAKK